MPSTPEQRRAYKQSRVDRGLCLDCPNGAEPLHRLCSVCMGNRREKQTGIRKRLRERVVINRGVTAMARETGLHTRQLRRIGMAKIEIMSDDARAVMLNLMRGSKRKVKA